MKRLIIFLIFGCSQLFSVQMGIVSGLDPNGDGFLALRDYPQGKRIGKLYNGNSVQILDGKSNWYKVKVDRNGIIGWSHSKWIKIQSLSNRAGYYKVTTHELNVRSKSGKHGHILGTVKNGKIIYIESFNGKWGKSSRGWISGKYLKKVQNYEKDRNTVNESTTATENITSEEESSVPWWKAAVILIVLGIFFSYWKEILGIGVIGVVGYLILTSLGINPWYLGIVIVIIIGLIIYYNCSGEKCPECGTCIKEPSQTELIEEHYKHATKTGAPDKRYTDNPLISTYEYTYICTNEDCEHMFTIEIEL